jgi:uncharacterized HAD superfamily protein
MSNKRKTIFLDIDGTILEHKENLHRMITEEPVVLDSVIDKFLQWRSEGHYIVLTTARVEGVRRVTEDQLSRLGIFFDQLVMGLTTGPRVLINDTKSDGTITALARPLDRNVGLGGIDL